jgi:flagellar biosynthetic protein FliQ
MTIDSVTELLRGALVTALVISAPVLLVAVVVGLAMSVLQTVTQIQDQTISLVPKIIAVLVTVLFVLPWALGRMVEYSTQLYETIPTSFL